MKEKIGVIVATEQEQLPFFLVFGKTTDVYEGAYKVFAWKKYQAEIFLIKSGYGEIAAASATQYIIDNFHIDKIVNYGVVGSLKEDLHVNDVGVVRKIVHYGFDVSGTGKYPLGRYPNQDDLFIVPKKEALSNGIIDSLDEFVCASADKFVEGREKQKLQKDFNADICEMEAAAIVITCNKNNIPCSFIKAVSDGANEGEEAFKNNVYEASRICTRLLAKMLKI